MQAEILATGDEIRTGALVDSNSAHIAGMLEQNGIEVTRHQAVGDDLAMLVSIIGEISRRADVAVVTGGLGPTQDDLSSAAAAQAAGVELVEDQRALAEIEAFFSKRGRAMNPSNRKQALFPKGAACLYNALGTAPGFRISIGRCTFFFLPGVPHEMQAMLAEQVLPEVLRRQGGARAFRMTRVVSSFGLPESAVGEKVAAIGTVFPEIKLGLRAKFPEIQVKLYLNTADEANGQMILSQAVDWVAGQLEPHAFSVQERTLAEEVGDLLKQRGATLALAESCTGGLIADWLTNTAGSSDYFLLSAVTYANAAKIKVLGVSEDTLQRCGAVDEETARQMAEGARRAAGATYGLGVTGIAGPGGGSPEKPVGTVCLGLSDAEQCSSRKFTISFGRRLMNKRIFAMLALDFVRRRMLGKL
ncbi:MAG: competence/damage-inducible protein A [Desulfobacteraceae bacterium]|nr:MAG: competence/damage-inducible protein A [Desulfobacteraceae bacterium]